MYYGNLAQDLQFFFSPRLMSVALLKLSHLISGSNEILTLKLFGNLFLMFKCFEKV